MYPDFVNAPLKAFRITANDHKTITIQNGDLTVDGAISDQFRVQWPQPLGGSQGAGGYDGIVGVVDASYMTPHLDPTPAHGFEGAPAHRPEQGPGEGGVPGRDVDSRCRRRASRSRRP
jgi:hypothetical protein